MEEYTCTNINYVKADDTTISGFTSGINENLNNMSDVISSNLLQRTNSNNNCLTNTIKINRADINIMNKIKSVKIINNKVIILEFIDKIKTKAVCCDEDTFDLDTGIIICINKYLLGSNYRKTIKHVKRLYKEQEDIKLKEKLEFERKKKRHEKKQAKLKAKIDKNKQEITEFINKNIHECVRKNFKNYDKYRRYMK